MSGQLLNALALQRPGITIHMAAQRMTTAALAYDPFVVGVGPTLTDAASDCARWLLDVVQDHPDYRKKIPAVLKAIHDCNPDLKQDKP